MTKQDKNAYIQLEKAYETVCKTQVKINLIDKNYEDMFKTHDDYQSLKHSYKLEEKYATLKCKDIISNNKTLNKKRKEYNGFKTFYKAKSLIYDIALVFVPIFFGGLVYSIIKSSSLIWLFAGLSVMSLGILGYIYFNKSKEVDEYMGPTSMQIKVLKRIDSLLLSGQLYEEVIKDCQLQYAKRNLIKKAKEKKLVLNYDLTETNVYPKYVENYIYAYSGLTNVKNLMEIKDYYKSASISVPQKKKSSESSVYAKYAKKTEKKQSAPIKKKPSESATYLKYMSENSMTSKFKSDKTVVARYEGNSTITRVALDIEKPKKIRKKSSESSIYQKYIQQKATTK